MGLLTVDRADEVKLLVQDLQALAGDLHRGKDRIGHCALSEMKKPAQWRVSWGCPVGRRLTLVVEL